MSELAPIVAGSPATAEAVDLRDALHRFIDGRLKDRSESEDLVQETYLRLYDYGRTRTVADVGAFCFAVARNLIRDHMRRLRAAPVAAEMPEDVVCPEPRADEILAYRERVELLKRALRAMPALRREVFTRRRLDGQNVMTIANDMGLSTHAVEKHVSRATADLRAALARHDLSIGGRS